MNLPIRAISSRIIPGAFLLPSIPKGGKFSCLKLYFHPTISTRPTQARESRKASQRQWQISDARNPYSNRQIHLGGPLSPLLANVVLDELDMELAISGGIFVRYADDMMIFCRNKASSFQALKHIAPFIEGNLFLRINGDKTIIARQDCGLVPQTSAERFRRSPADVMNTDMCNLKLR